MICPVCDSGKTEFYGKVERFKPALFYQKCLHCESVFQRETAPDPDDYYNEDYYSGNASFAYHDGRKSYPADRIVHRARLQTILRMLSLMRGHMVESSSLKLLDVGCAFGSFVRSANEFMQAAGLDVSRYSITAGNEWIAKQKNPAFLGLHRGSLWHLPRLPLFANETFDVITLVEVAEHLHNPRANFESAYRLLKPGGLLLIQTANFSGWQAIKEQLNYHYLLPGHLVCYSSGGLTSLLKDIGFREFREFIPVDFPLSAKLKKAGYGFKFLNLFKMIKIAAYHWRSQNIVERRPATSSWVLYAFK